MSETLAEKVVAFIDEINREAVEADRKRRVAILTKAKDDAIFQGEYSLAATIGDLRDALLTQAGEPPPADEPMTIPKLIEKLAAVSNANWNTIRSDLQALVEARTRRDAAVCEKLAAAGSSDNDGWILACQACNELILKSAGLE